MVRENIPCVCLQTRRAASWEADSGFTYRRIRVSENFPIVTTERNTVKVWTGKGSPIFTVEINDGVVFEGLTRMLGDLDADYAPMHSLEKGSYLLDRLNHTVNYISDYLLQIKTK